jgi:hypothetical protein
MTYLPLKSVLAGWRDGDEREGGWEEEFRFLRTEHFEHLMEVTQSIIRGGICEPIMLGSDGRVWDGHHRLCAAQALYLEYVPVAFAPPEAPQPDTGVESTAAHLLGLQCRACNHSILRLHHTAGCDYLNACDCDQTIGTALAAALAGRLLDPVTSPEEGRPGGDA